MSDDSQTIYAKLRKPKWAPAGWVFRPVWTVLYGVIALSFGTVFYRVLTGEWPWTMAIPFILNIVANLAFLPLQFKHRQPLLASLDLLLIIVTLVAAMVTVAPRAPWIAWVNVPHLFWVGFAGALQVSIMYMNAM